MSKYQFAFEVVGHELEWLKGYPQARLLVSSSDSVSLIGAEFVRMNPGFLYCLVKSKDGILILAESQVTSEMRVIKTLAGSDLQNVNLLNPVTHKQLRLIIDKGRAGFDTVCATHNPSDYNKYKNSYLV